MSIEREKVQISLEGIKGFLFDMDGTLVDSEKYMERFWKSEIERMNKKYCLNIHFEYVSGVGPRNIYKSWKEEGGGFKQFFRSGLFDDMYESFVCQRINHFCREDGFELFEDVGRMIEDLKQRALKIALVTSSQRVYTDGLLGKHEHLPFSKETVVSADDVEYLKPHPESYVKGAESIEVCPSQCIAFEDTLSGVQSAVSAGVKMVIVRGEVPEAFREAENVVGVDSFDDIEFV